MNLSLRSLGFELKCPAAVGTQNTNVMFFGTKSSVRVACFTKNDGVQISNHDGRSFLVSSHFIPGHLEDSSKNNKQLKGPAQKLNYVRTLLIDNYDSYTYNIYQELSVINGVAPLVIRNDEWTWEEFCYHLYEEKAFDNIVISPGPGSPTCPGDIGICIQVLRGCWDVPILGVCLGHQALGHIHGAQVVHAPEPIHGSLSEIEHNGCKIFHGIPSGRNSGFKVVRYHSLVIDSETLPEELIPIAWTSSSARYYIHDSCDVTSNGYENQKQKNVYVDAILGKRMNGNSNILLENPSRRVLMGVMHATRPHYGLQFHPESIATCHGRQIFKNFRAITEDYWRSWRSSYKSERYAPITAMQVLATDQLHEEVPRSVEFENSTLNYWYRKTPKNGQPKKRVFEPNHFPLSNIEINQFASNNFKNLKLSWRKYDRLVGQVGGAKNIFCGLFGHNKAENTFWLDSSSIEKRRARFSFMGGKGGSLWKQLMFKLSDQSDVDSQGGHLSIEDSEGYTEHIFLEEGFLEYLNKELQSFRYDDLDYKGLPFDFHGGYVGYIGYDLKVECGAKSNRHTSKTPDACFFFADNLLVIDHQTDDVYLMTIREGSDTVTPWLDETEEKLLRLKDCTAGELSNHVSHPPGFPTSNAGFITEKSRVQYIDDVGKCLRYIKDGESYELCLTTQIRKKIKESDYLGLYLHLREKNPAPYAAWLNFPKDDLCICCSSPERFLRLDGNGMLEAKPIKGTIARGATKEEDELLKFKLQYSGKDQSENLMIVDLLRNDLGRVCEPGTVHVPLLMDVESYATVHTMVSTICGEKRSDVSAIACIKSAFPGGSMTGAPKLRSMEILDSIENCSRGIYSGSIGFFSYNQTFDLNIVIRTVIIHKGEASIGAGGAIVALSNPEDEYEEMILKTRAPARAVMEFQ